MCGTPMLGADRIEAFSDGILAIVITLLVLEMHVPSGGGTEAELWRALRGLLSPVAARVVRFASVLVFWVSHHHLFAQLRGVNRACCG